MNTAEEKRSELKEQLLHHESQLSQWNRMWHEKKDFGYFENISFEEIENYIDIERERLKKINQKLESIS
jgi:RNA polymerase-binding transcription factor DksA